MSNMREPGSARSMSTLDSLPQLQASLAFSRRARPPPVLMPSEMEERVPLKPAKVHRKESKGGLRGLFHRDKAEKSLVSPVLEEPMLSSGMQSLGFSVSTPKSATTEANVPRTIASKGPPTISRPIPLAPSTPIGPGAKSSRANLKMNFTKSTKMPTKPSPKPSKASSKSSGKYPTRTLHTWDPPPLFQAYPQAIKYAQLSTSTLSADAILRISNHKRNSSLRDEFGQTRDGKEQRTSSGKKTENAKRHRRQISGSISKAAWTQKIFILVTSGYLLQYCGDGSFDRLPEKMMQLGKDSVAFASDVIPGKHWVLQVSQAMDADGKPVMDSRSLLSRLAFRGADYKRTATSLLLVLNSAEDMDSWLAIVRREIEALGGKKHVSETGKPQPDDKVLQLKTRPSHRFLVQRDPDQFSHSSSPQESTFMAPFVQENESKGDDSHTEEEESRAAPFKPEFKARPSTGYQSVCNSITSHDEQRLESLRDSTRRFSYMSSGQRTLVTSQGSSPCCSPTQDTFEEVSVKMATDDVKLRPNAAAINERRRSMHTMQVQNLDVQLPLKNFRHSTYGGPAAKPVQMHSLGTPNFSVPRSSSKRYSTMKSPVTMSERTPQNLFPNELEIPNQEAFLLDRPPSSLKDVNFSKLDLELENLSTAPNEQIKYSMADVRPRSSRLSSSLPTSDLSLRPPRMPSLVPLAPANSEFLDFQFPRKFASTETLRPNGHPVAAPPSTLLPPPPAILDETAMPKMILGQPNTPIEPESETVSPLPVLANTKTKIRRPLSIQVQPSRSPSYKSPRSKQLPLTRTLSTGPRIITSRPPSMQIHPSPRPSTSSRKSKPFQIEQPTKNPRRTSMQFPLSSKASIELGNSQLSPPPTAPLPRVPSIGRSSSLTISPASGAKANFTPSVGASPFLTTSKRSLPPFPASPCVQRLKDQEKKAMGNRRSMSILSPPAPPPDCALPPLPPGGEGQENMVRESIRVKA